MPTTLQYNSICIRQCKIEGKKKNKINSILHIKVPKSSILVKLKICISLQNCYNNRLSLRSMSLSHRSVLHSLSLWWWLVGGCEVVVGWVWRWAVRLVCWLLGFGLNGFCYFGFEMFWCFGDWWVLISMGFGLNVFWCLVAKKMKEKKQKY